MNTNAHRTMEIPDIVLLADGDYPAHAIPLAILNGARRLYCCDHAGLAAIEHGLKPTAIVGDGDSLTTEQKAQMGRLYHQVDEQDYNDLTKALRLALGEWHEAARPRVALLGTTGKREDHTLANISLVAWYARTFPILPTLFTNHGTFTPARGRHTFHSFPGQQVSIFNLGCTRLASEGLRWPSYPYAELWQGSLNEATGSEFILDGDADYLVFQTYAKKEIGVGERAVSAQND